MAGLDPGVVTSPLAALQLDKESGKALSQDEVTLFRCVEEGNVAVLRALLANRKVDVNVYNEDGITALHLAVCKYDIGRDLHVAETLIEHGGDVCLKAAAPPFFKLSLTRPDQRHPHLKAVHETHRVAVGQKTPLVIALELKSALYLKAWEYRHWDLMLKLLSDAVVNHYADRGFVDPPVRSSSCPELVQRNWILLFQGGKHDLVELRVDGEVITALKLLLTGASKVFKANFEHSSRLEVKDTSFPVIKALVQFLYTGAISSQFIERRGIDLLSAAHNYAVESLLEVCESQIQPTQDNWIKLLSVAIECESDVLVLKCAKSIKEVMARRHDSSTILKKSFSEGHDGPHQLFGAS